jgi:preprotein translocase subunit YajC
MGFLLLQGQAPPSPLMQFLPIILIFGIFYFLLFLPMQKQKKRQKQMLANLAAGDSVLTTGGIIGTVVSLGEDDTLVIRVKPGDVKLTVARGSVSSLLSGEKKS